MKLREVARRARGVDLLEATVTELLLDEDAKDSVRGVRASVKGVAQDFYSKLVIIADGPSSNFRSVDDEVLLFYKMTQRQVAVGSSSLSLRLPDFPVLAFSSSSTTSCGLTVM